MLITLKNRAPCTKYVYPMNKQCVLLRYVSRTGTRGNKFLQECDKENIFSTDIVCIKVFPHPLTFIMFLSLFKQPCLNITLFDKQVLSYKISPMTFWQFSNLEAYFVSSLMTCYMKYRQYPL